MATNRVLSRLPLQPNVLRCPTAGSRRLGGCHHKALSAAAAAAAATATIAAAPTSSSKTALAVRATGLPLEGITVVDMTRVLAGPYSTMMFADQGAQVIKIERPKLGDETRHWGPPFVGDQSTYFLSVNRNKRSIAIDIKQPAGLEVVRRLVGNADVFIENFLPGTLDKAGLGWGELSVLNPGLVYASITGYGATGPYKGRGGYDVIASAVGGLMDITGPVDGSPCKVGVAMTDLQTGLHAYGSILAALLARHRTGRGARIECSLLETQVASLANVASAYLNAGVTATRMGTSHASIVPYQSFPTADGFIVVAAMNDAQFGKLCGVMALPELRAHPDYCTNPKRVKHRDGLLAILVDRFECKTTAAWSGLLADSGLAYGPINDTGQVFADPQVIHRDMIMELDHPTVGPVRVPGLPVKYSTKDGGPSPNTAANIAPPILGQHTREVLAELDYSADEIESLIDANVVECASV